MSETPWNWVAKPMHADCEVCKMCIENAIEHLTKTGGDSGSSSFMHPDHIGVKLHSADVSRPADKPFCDQCAGPYTDDWLMERYGGHWDTCPNRATALLP